MHFHILTLFPDMVMSGLNTSIIGRAVKNDLLTIDAVNIRDFAFNKHQSVDDYPYGGGAGTVSYTHLDVYKRQIYYTGYTKKLCYRCFPKIGSQIYDKESCYVRC